MKKLMMIAAMMVATLSVSAQYEPGTWSIMPKIGINVASMTNAESLPITGATNLDKQPLGGSLVGVEMEYQLTNMFSLSAGLHFSEQGQGWKDFKGTIDGQSMEIRDPKMDLEYFNIPILANIYLYKGLAIKAGVQFGFLTDANMKMTEESKVDLGDGTKRDMTIDTTLGMKDDCKTTDISIPIGISYEFKNHLILDARYNLGLNKINKESVQGEKDTKNSVFSLTIGYKIGL